MTARKLHLRVAGQLVEKIRSMVAFGWIGHLLALFLIFEFGRLGVCGGVSVSSVILFDCLN
jgi:hypothetical protein